MYALRQLLIQQALKKSSGNISYPGLIAAWSAKGKTNDDEDRATLKDLTGNGHDITLNGFAFNKMSGYGGYDYIIPSPFMNRFEYTKYGDNKFVFHSINTNGTYLFSITSNNYISGRKFKFRISNVSNIDSDYKFYITVSGETILLDNITEPGEYEVNFPDVDDNFDIRFSGLNTNSNIEGFTFEFISNYPGALVFDGVDDYGSAVDFGGKEIKTVISKYQTIKLAGNKFSMYFRDPLDGYNYRRIYTKQIENYPSIRAYSDNVKLLESYVSLQVGTSNAANKPFQITGYKGNKEIEAIAFYSAYLFDRSLDEQEIKSFIRKYIDPEYLLPSEIPTPDCYYDFSQGSNDDENRETIKDYSGNGNDAVAHNFAWSGMSGYGGYNFSFYNTKVNTITADITKNKINVTNITGDGKISYAWAHVYSGIINKAYKINVIGIVNGMVLTYQYFDINKEIKTIEITKDGIYSIPEGYGIQGTEIINYTGFNMSNFTGECNITIELLPEYPGALVLDGVNDYISLDAFNSGFKTMFMLVNPFAYRDILYDQRTNSPKNDYALYTEENSIAYNARNLNGTFINNKLSSYKVNEVINKKQLIMIKSQLTEIYQPALGSNQSHSSNFSNMAIYKFLGFKEALTEEQIQAVIKKYNLLDGVDEIEVN